MRLIGKLAWMALLVNLLLLFARDELDFVYQAF